MRSSAAVGRYPYVIVVRYMPMIGDREDYPGKAYKHLRDARTACLAATRAWAQMIGAQYPGIGWYVIDTRDGTEHHPTTITQGAPKDGTETTGHSGLF